MADDPISRILDLARWAPSGDNVQPWRFRRLDDETVRIDTRDQSKECLYDRDGRCGLVSIGILLETLRLAATTQGRQARIVRIAGTNPLAPTFSATFAAAPGGVPDHLARWIRQRSVHRGAYATRALSANEIESLQGAIGSGFTLHLASGGERRRWAGLNQRAALLRLDTREGWELMRQIIEWDARFSIDRLPDQAIGLPHCLLGAIRRMLMTWSWERIHFSNRYLGGTWGPRLLLDWWPGLRCGAHLAIHAVSPDESTDGWLRAGAAVQRLWLTATSLGLQHQPGATPLVFARYARDGLPFTDDPSAISIAHGIAADMRHLLGQDALERVVWMGRIGEAEPSPARSIRLPVSTLCSGQPRPS